MYIKASSISTRSQPPLPFASTRRRSSCSLNAARCACFKSAPATRNTVVLIDCFELERKDWQKLRHFFHSPVRYWMAHNAVFDLGLQEYDIYPAGDVVCTMLASRLITNGVPNFATRLDSLVKSVSEQRLAQGPAKV